MPFTILLTGFGPFPGAPYNPTGPLVKLLARRRHPDFAGVRRIAHVFTTSYATIDRELPALIARAHPDMIVMFGLAQQTKHLRIETLARNVRSLAHADVTGLLPTSSMIVPAGAPAIALRAPARRLLAAVRNTGLAVALSDDAGSYLCNYLCWRASEAARAPRGPRLVAFVHVPKVRRGAGVVPRCRGVPATLGDLVNAGETILRTALASARPRR